MARARRRRRREPIARYAIPLGMTDTRRRRPAVSLSRAFALAASLLAPTMLAAQGYPFSQRTDVTQHIAHTTLRVEYGRPVARGRVLFGQLVPWDSVWHPGADDATTLKVDHDILLDGQPLKAGIYSLWLIPRASAPWTFIVSRTAKVSHKDYPGRERDALRLEVAPDSVSHMESMSIYFPTVLRDDGVLRIHWGTQAISLRVKAPYAPQ